MEQGLALEELVEIDASIRARGTKGVRWEQWPPTEGAAGRADVPPSSERFDGEGIVARREGGIPGEAGKYSNS